jgi:hypothetical protein
VTPRRRLVPLAHELHHAAAELGRECNRLARPWPRSSPFHLAARVFALRGLTQRKRLHPSQPANLGRAGYRDHEDTHAACHGLRASHEPYSMVKLSTRIDTSLRDRRANDEPLTRRRGRRGKRVSRRLATTPRFMVNLMSSWHRLLRSSISPSTRCCSATSSLGLGRRAERAGPGRAGASHAGASACEPATQGRRTSRAERAAREPEDATRRCASYHRARTSERASVVNTERINFALRASFLCYSSGCMRARAQAPKQPHTKVSIRRLRSSRTWSSSRHKCRCRRIHNCSTPRHHSPQGRSLHCRSSCKSPRPPSLREASPPH